MSTGHGFPWVADISSMNVARFAASVLALAAGCGDGRAASAPVSRDPTPAVRPPDAPAKATPSSRSARHETSEAEGSPRAARAAVRVPRPEELERYRWLEASTSVRSLAETIPAPPGFTRVALAPTSFGAFLRDLPLLPRGAAVHAYDGRELLAPDDPRIAAVVAMDAGTRDLQQCADTAIRLHAEWLWSRGREKEIGYHFTSGDLSTWSAYAAGDRPQVEARAVKWARTAPASGGRGAFRAYLDQVFTYAGTVSLAREAKAVDRNDLRVGDVLVLPGGPGHTVVIADLAVDEAGHRRGLLVQGFMPAQEAHVLASGPGEAWFDLDGDAVDTPFWSAPFPWSSLRRMRTASGDPE